MNKTLLSLDDNSDLYKRIVFEAIENQASIEETVIKILDEKLEEYSTVHNYIYFERDTQFYIYALFDIKTGDPFYIGMTRHPISFDHRGNVETRRHIGRLNKISEGSSIKILEHQLTEEEAEDRLEDLIRHHKPIDEDGTLFNKQDVCGPRTRYIVNGKVRR